MRLVSEWNIHWRMRDLLWEVLMNWMKDPPPGRAFCWMDFLKVDGF